MTTKETLVVDYTEIATILLDNLHNNYPDFCILEINEYPEAVATFMQNKLEPELIHEFMSTPLGQGMLIGILTAAYGEAMLADESDGIIVTDEEGIKDTSRDKDKDGNDSGLLN